MKSNFDSESVRHYISLLQDNINRMALNCRNCKTWLMPILIAVFTLPVSSVDPSKQLMVAIATTVLFFFMDTYYLGEEKRFRDIERSFVDKVRSGMEYEQDLYYFTSDVNSKYEYLLKGIQSNSTFVFYGVILVVIMLISVI